MEALGVVGLDSRIQESAHGGGGKSAMRIVIIKQGQPHILEVSVDAVGGVLDLQHETPDEERGTAQRGEQNGPFEDAPL